MEKLDIKQLEVFCTVMERGSATIAAQVLGMTQPGVSHLLTKLEDALGYALFRREHRRLVPTAEAQVLVHEVASVLDRHQQLSARARDILQTRSGNVCVASHPGPSIAWLPEVMAQFMAERPDVTVQLISRQSQGVRDLNSVRAFDVALAELPIEHPLLVLRRYAVPFVAVLQADSPLAVHSVLTPQLLDGQAFVSMFRGHAAQLGVRQAFDAAGAQLRVVAECDYFASALSLAGRGVGVALVDALSVPRAVSSHEVVVRPFTPSLTYEFALFHPHDRPLSKLAQAFVETLDAYLQTLGVHTTK